MTKDDKDCLFCRIRRGEIPTNLIYSDDKCFVVLDIYPSQKGHMLVIPKDHSKNMFISSDPVNSHLLKVARKFGKKAMEKLKAPGVKLVINIGREAGQLIDHTHIHIIPHYHMIEEYSTGPNPQLSEKEARELLSLLSEIDNVHASQLHNLDT